jgi:proprotein convertase subtilisin/kexin type 5
LITTEDSFNRVCQPCPINCSQCSGSTFVTCTMCNIGYLLDQGGCYLSCQTPNTVPSVNGLTCSSCSSICLTCAITQYNCLSCNTSSVNKYLFSNNCLSSCGNGYYNNDNLNTCTQCNSPCETCLNSSMSSCLTCVANSYLYGTVCILACPSEYFLNGSVCSACQSPCK